MSKFSIDFFELSFLAEACIPPRPIARAVFWQNLIDVYWEQMTENERSRLFAWMNRNDIYKESLLKEEDTKIFHARFDPENQYMVEVNFDGEQSKHRAFKRSGDELEGFSNRYYVGRTKWIEPKYIVSVNKLNLKID